MRVCLINQYALPPRGMGGTRHVALGRRLAERGHAVSIVASSLTYTGETICRLEGGSAAASELVDGVTFHWLRGRPYRGNGVGRVLNMLDFAARATLLGERALGGRPDIVVGSSPSPFAALAALCVARRFGAPFVLEVRDLWPESLIELGRFAARHPFIQLLAMVERLLYRCADGIVTLLPGAARHIRAVADHPGEITWIPNGIDLDLLPPFRPPPNRDEFVLIYAGAHGIANALDELLDAARLLQERGSTPALRIRLIGEGPEKRRLQQRAADEGLRGVRFDPAVSKRDVYKALEQGDAFVACLSDAPLYRFGISLNKLFDYLAVGRPVILAAAAANDPVAEAGAGVTVPPGNPAALAAAIERVYRMTGAERQALGVAGRAHVVERYDFGLLAQRFESLLDGISRSGRGVSAMPPLEPGG